MGVCRNDTTFPTSIRQMASALRGELGFLRALLEARWRVVAPGPRLTRAPRGKIMSLPAVSSPLSFRSGCRNATCFYPALFLLFCLGTKACVALVSVCCCCSCVLLLLSSLNENHSLFSHLEVIPLQKSVARQCRFLIGTTRSSQLNHQCPEAATLFSLASERPAGGVRSRESRDAFVEGC